MNLRPLTLLSLLLLLLMPVLATAQEKPKVVLNLSVQKEVIVKDENGKARTEWQEFQKSEPGELLKYTITYKNEGGAEARNVVIVDPIPKGTVFVANGAEGKNSDISFSVDGKKFHPPLLLKYKAPQGGEEYFASPEMYTHIRWKLTKAVPPGGTGSVSFKVKVR